MEHLILTICQCRFYMIFKEQFEWNLHAKRLCEKISVNSTTVIKNDIVERLEKQPLNFFTVYNKYRNLSSFFNSQSAGVQRPQTVRDKWFSNRWQTLSCFLHQHISACFLLDERYNVVILSVKMPHLRLLLYPKDHRHISRGHPLHRKDSKPIFCTFVFSDMYG